MEILWRGVIPMMNVISNRMETTDLISKVRSFEGHQYVYRHKSSSNHCMMTFGVYVPLHSEGDKLPALLYLSGLTCTHANVMEKGGVQQWASKYKMIFIHPDTSPRGEGVADSDRWDLGQGASFYVNATQKPWNEHFQMKSYIENELVSVVGSLVPSLDERRIGITGHSMGGHGAITLGLSRPDVFKSISAFAPISHPTNCEWGKLALSTYLGQNEEEWKKMDGSLMIQSYIGPKRHILFTQGTDDKFYIEGQLQPESLKSTDNVLIEGGLKEGFDHSYYFVSTFMEEHFVHHSNILAVIH